VEKIAAETFPKMIRLQTDVGSMEHLRRRYPAPPGPAEPVRQRLGCDAPRGSAFPRSQERRARR
jgi:hypothetical protein